MEKKRLIKGCTYLITASFLFLSPVTCLLSNGVNTSAFAQEAPKLKGYTYNLKQLLEQVEGNLKKVDKQIQDAEIIKRNQEREAQVRELFETGNQRLCRNPLGFIVGISSRKHLFYRRNYYIILSMKKDSFPTI